MKKIYKIMFISLPILITFFLTTQSQSSVEAKSLSNQINQEGILIQSKNSENSSKQPRVQIYKFSILFPPGVKPPSVYITSQYTGYLKNTLYVGGAQYVGEYVSGW